MIVPNLSLGNCTASGVFEVSVISSNLFFSEDKYRQ